MGRAGLLLLGLLAVSVVHAGVDLVTREVLGRACKRYIDKDPLLPCDSTFSDKASELKICKRMRAALDKFGFSDINTADPNANKWKTQCESAYKDMPEPPVPPPPAAVPAVPAPPPAVKIEPLRQDSRKCFVPAQREAVYTCQEEFE